MTIIVDVIDVPWTIFFRQYQHRLFDIVIVGCDVDIITCNIIDFDVCYCSVSDSELIKRFPNRIDFYATDHRHQRSFQTLLYAIFIFLSSLRVYNLHMNTSKVETVTVATWK